MTKRLTITAWTITVDWSDGKIESISDMPDDVSQPIDNFLSTIESERNDKNKELE